MTPEMQAFINFFADEEELRSAIEALLARQEECRGVRNLHGKDEAGKDIVFYAPTALGRMSLNACVVKLSKITGSASDAKSGARNVFIQCDQALDTPVLDIQGREEWVSHIYVMSPNELSATAMQSVAGCFKGKPSQIEFICGQDFLLLFKQCWPDFIFFQPDLLSAHLETIRKELESDIGIKRLAIVHGLNATTNERNIYVDPLLSQVRGKLSRGSDLPDRRFFASINSEEDFGGVRSKIDNLINSLRIVSYLPYKLIADRADAERDIANWKLKIEKQWHETFYKNRAQSNVAIMPVSWRVPLPAWVADLFFESRECKYFMSVYSSLDEEICIANESVNGACGRSEILNSPSFSVYGLLVHATSDCYPTITFEGDHLIEWSTEEVLAANRNLLITGGPGIGKTSFCRKYFLNDLGRFKAGTSKILPLYFAAHSMKMDSARSFEDVFIRPEVASRLALDSSLSVRIYLDGLDEIRSIELREQILEILRERCEAKSSRYRCLATARDHVGGYSTRWLVRLNISPMSKSALHELITSWLDGNDELIALFYSELKAAESLVQVLTVPLLATITILVFRSLRRLPENRLRLYQMFIDLLLGGWNLVKGLQRTAMFSSTTKLLILTRLAGLIHGVKKRACNAFDFDAALRQVAPSLTSDSHAILSELVEDGLLVPTGRMSYTFPHLSFQEYLAARDAVDPAREEQRRVIEKYLNGDDWYREVAIFIVSMTTNPSRMRDWVESVAQSLDSSYIRSDHLRRGAYLNEQLSKMFL